TADEIALAERGDLVADLLDQVLGASGLLVDRLADALLDLGAVLFQRRLHFALAFARLALDPVAGLFRLRRRFATGGGAAALGPFQGPAQLGAVGLDLLLGRVTTGEGLDQLTDAVGDAEHGADREVEGGGGDSLGLVFLSGGLGGGLGASFG